MESNCVSTDGTRKRNNVLKNNVETVPSNHGANVDDTDESFAIAQDLMVKKIRNKMQDIRESLIHYIDLKSLEMVNAVIDEMQKNETTMTPNKPLFQSAKLEKRATEQGGLPDKEFRCQRSLLTELFESQHIKTIYHIFIAILILLFLNTVTYDFVDTGKINLDFKLIQWTFSGFHIVLTIWALMKLSTIMIVYPGFQYWALNRYNKPYFWDYIWLVIYILYLCMFMYFPASKTVEHDLPIASSLVVLMEQVRQVMKVHAFVRSNIPRAMKYHPNNAASNDGEKAVACPDFSKYLYFLFAPTLVYRDHYPRNSHIDWQYAVNNLGQVVGCLFYTYFIFVRFCVPVFHKFGREPMSPKNLVLSVFGCMLPGTLVLLCGFFAILHAWLNAFAEMLQFADRMFYRDWWNSTTFANYYRTWNVVVHDWLYAYVYKDVYALVKHSRRNRVIPKITVFAVSSLFHEYIAALTFRFFYPILFVMFGNVGVMFVFLTEKREGRKWNIFFWVMIFLGTGVLMSLYSMEFYARINCPSYTDPFLDLFIPRSWVCDAIRP